MCVYNEDVGLGVIPLHVGDREIATNELVEPTPGAGAYREINSATVTSAGAGAIFITPPGTRENVGARKRCDVGGAVHWCRCFSFSG